MTAGTVPLPYPHHDSLIRATLRDVAVMPWGRPTRPVVQRQEPQRGGCVLGRHLAHHTPPTHAKFSFQSAGKKQD